MRAHVEPRMIMSSSGLLDEVAEFNQSVDSAVDSVYSGSPLGCPTGIVTGGYTEPGLDSTIVH